MRQKYKTSDEQKARDREIASMRSRILLEYLSDKAEIYDMDPQIFFQDSFRTALSTNTPESIKQIGKLSSGVLKLKMMSSAHCRVISREIDCFQTWCTTNGFKLYPPSRIYKHDVTVLEDFGLGKMIDKLVRHYLQPIINGFFGYVGHIDSHVSFRIKFGAQKERYHIGLNFHDDSDITLKLCLRDMDSEGVNLQFEDPICKKHEGERNNTRKKPMEMKLGLGQAVMHCGRHGNGILPITREQKDYLVIWCKSSVFGMINELKNEFPEWCVVCQALSKERRRKSYSDLRKAILGDKRPGKKPKT